MAGIIPLDPGDPEQRFELTLEEIRYECRVRWNSRLELWFIDILEAASRSPVALGRALVLGELIAKAELGGALMMVDWSRTGREAGLADLGTRVELWYLGPDDLLRAQQPLATETPTP